VVVGVEVSVKSKVTGTRVGVSVEAAIVRGVGDKSVPLKIPVIATIASIKAAMLMLTAITTIG
jgi:hypothetical protein